MSLVDFDGYERMAAFTEQVMTEFTNGLYFEWYVFAPEEEETPGELDDFDIDPVL